MNTPVNADAAAAMMRRVRHAQEMKLRYFALTVKGDALSPRFRDDQIVAIDTETTPEAGDVILTEIDGVICLMAMNGDGDLTDNRGGFESLLIPWYGPTRTPLTQRIGLIARLRGYGICDAAGS